MSQISSWKRAKAVQDNMLQEEEELDYEIDIEDEDRLLESSGEESSDNSPPNTTHQSPESSESEESPSYSDSLSTTNADNLTQSRPNFREKMNYLKCCITYANSLRSNYRYVEPNTHFSDATDEEDHVDEPNICVNSIDSQDSKVSKSSNTEQVQNSTNYLIHNNNKETLDFSNNTVMSTNDTMKPTTTIFHEQNNTYGDFGKKSRTNVAIQSRKNVQTTFKSKNFNIIRQISPKATTTDATAAVPMAKTISDQNNTYEDISKNSQSAKNRQTPIQSKKKSPNFIRTFTRSNNTLTSPNATTDTTESVPTAETISDQSNTYEDISKNSQTNVAIQTAKNVQTPIKSKKKSPNFIRTFTRSDNTLTCPNSTTDPAESVPTAKTISDQNNTYEDISKNNQTNVAIQSAKNVPTAIKSKKKSPNFIRTFTRSNNTLTSPNATSDHTESLPKAKIFHDQNNTYEDVPKTIQTNVAIQSAKNVPTPIKSKQKSPDCIRRFTRSNNTVTRLNDTTNTNPTEAVPTAKTISDQNNTYEDIWKNSQTNIDIQSAKNVQTPITSTKKSPNFIRTFTCSNNTLTTPNATTTDPTESVPAAKTISDQNNTYENISKNSQTNVAIQSAKNMQIPIKSTKKSPNLIRRSTRSTKTLTSPNSTTDPTESVPTATIFHDQNNTNEDVPKTSQTSVAIQSAKNVQTIIKSKNKSPGFVRQIASTSESSTIKIPGKLNVLPFQSSKKVKEPIKSKKKTSSSELDAMAIQSPQKADDPFKSFSSIKEISESGTGTAKKSSTETVQTSNTALENLQGPNIPQIRPSNFKIQLKGKERMLLCPPQISQVNPIQPSQQIKENKLFTRKLICEEHNISFNTKDISWYLTSYNAKDTKDDTSSLGSNSNFKVPLKRPPFKPKWQTSSAPVEVPSYRSQDNDDTEDIISLINGSTIASDGDDNQDDTPLDYNEDNTRLDDDGASLGEGIPNRLDMVGRWVNEQQQGRIPLIFKGICYNYFLRNYCNTNLCRNQHNLRVHFARKRSSSNITKEEVEVALSFAMGIPSFYKQVFPIFAEFFGFKDNKEGLICLVHQIFSSNFPIDQVSALNTVLINLQQTDLKTLKESMEYVLMQVGFKSYSSFGATLVEIIISLEDISSYWPIMRRMINGGLTLTMHLAKKFLTKLVKMPVDLNVCRDVYAVFLKYQFLKLAAISNEIRDPFLKLAQQPERRRSNVALEGNWNNGVDPQRVQDFSVPSAFPHRVSTNMLSSNANDNLDFASLCRGEETPHFNGGDRIYGSAQHGCDYRESSSRPNQSKININKRPSDFYSSDDDSSREDIHSISSGNRFPDRSGYTYIPEGSRYDPTKDYVSLSQRKHQQPQSRDGEFHRLSRDDSEPAQKKFRLNPGRLASGIQNNDIVNTEFDERAAEIHEARLRQELQISKPPDKPVFGKLCFNPDYILDVSLHNLYVKKMGSINIDEGDVLVLNETLVVGNGEKFLQLVEKYQDSLTLQHFISMTLAHLKSYKRGLARVWKRLLDSIGRAKPNFYGSSLIRAILEVISMNLLFLLIKLNLFLDAKELLMKFTDWDSLVTSRVFIIEPRSHLSIVGRYLFIAKLIQPTIPELCLGILTCPSFKLMHYYSMWPYYNQAPEMSTSLIKKDLTNRNRLLTAFLQEIYQTNIEIVTDIYKMAFSRNSGIWSFNVIPYINPMIECLLNHNEISTLKHISKESKLFFNHMSENILKKFLIIMFAHLPESDGFKIFEKCISCSLYRPICINHILQENIVVNTSYSTKEIEIIIKYCFHKLVETRFLPSSGLKFWIQFTTNSGEGTNAEMTRIADEAIKENTAVTKVKRRIIRMLGDFFQICGRTTADLSVVEVAKDNLILFLESHQGL